MKALKKLWLRQDGGNRVILLSGTAIAVALLFTGKGMYGVFMVALMGAFCVSRQNGRIKRLSRLYGSLFYYLPDGEIFPVTFEQISAEYLRGQGQRYMERRVTVRYPYWRCSEEGELDTGFGLSIRLDGFEDTEDLLPRLRQGDFISVTGELLPEGKQYFFMGRVTEIRRISERELRMV